MQSLPFLELRVTPAPILDSYDEEARHAKAIHEDRQRYLEDLFTLTGEVQVNEYAVSPPLASASQGEAA